MSCGGEVTFLFELYRPLSWKIAVFGAGHVAQALVRILEPLSCQLSCIDPRPEWINRLPVGKKNISSLVNPNPADTVKTFDAQTYFVVMTQGHATDRPILLEIFSHFPNAPYIGVIGSKVKAIKLRAELKESGISAIALKKLHCPMGLLIGGNDPHEIAISVAAQLLQIRETID
jgi:xanthine dehydrogenase accessory factor